MQRNDCPIGEVVPLLLIMFEEYDKLKINGVPITGTSKSFKELLINSFKKKFEYELDSNVFLVSSIYTVSKLNLWYKRSFSKEYVTKGIAAILELRNCSYLHLHLNLRRRC